jgi:hypothetical protein
MKPTAHIENWEVMPGNFLRGTVSNHPRQRFFTQEFQYTSEILNLDLANNTCETRNTLYTLGKAAQ